LQLPESNWSPKMDAMPGRHSFVNARRFGFPWPLYSHKKPDKPDMRNRSN